MCGSLSLRLRFFASWVGVGAFVFGAGASGIVVSAAALGVSVGGAAGAGAVVCGRVRSPIVPISCLGVQDSARYVGFREGRSSELGSSDANF